MQKTSLQPHNCNSCQIERHGIWIYLLLRSCNLPRTMPYSNGGENSETPEHINKPSLQDCAQRLAVCWTIYVLDRYFICLPSVSTPLEPFSQRKGYSPRTYHGHPRSRRTPFASCKACSKTGYASSSALMWAYWVPWPLNTNAEPREVADLIGDDSDDWRLIGVIHYTVRIRPPKVKRIYWGPADTSGPRSKF